jgi:DNA-binding FadR family transcriptional regulator
LPAWAAMSSRVINSSDSPSSRKGAPQLASLIESDIIQAGWPVGQNFGVEDALLEHYGVGRAVFREAIRIVEQHQVATMRRGSKGGLIITAPHSSAIADAMGVYLAYAGITAGQLLEARAVIDPLAAAAAANRITETGIQRLRYATENSLDIQDSEQDLGDSLNLLIAEMSGDVALALFVEVINSLLLRFSAPKGSSADQTLETRYAHRNDRQELASAIMAGDAGQAVYLSRRNAFMAIRSLEESGDRTKDQQLGLKDVVNLRAEQVPRNGNHLKQGPKMAAVLADRIQSEIASRHWPVGERVGFEPELIASYGVSRAVLRETVRILEHRGVADMKMGPAGGLFVARPDPAAAAEAMGLLLQFRGISAAEVHHLRCGIELGCLDLIMEKAMTEVELERLRLATPQLALNQAPPQGFCSNLHIHIAELTGNPTLQVFLTSILSLWHFYAHRRPRPYSPTGGYNVHAAHESILDAMARGDRPVARERMLRHLESVDN